MQVNRGLEELMNRDRRYAPEAYEFVMQALAYAAWRSEEREVSLTSA